MNQIMRNATARMDVLNQEYKRGLITGVEFLAELTAQVKIIEDQRSDERF